MYVKVYVAYLNRCRYLSKPGICQIKYPMTIRKNFGIRRNSVDRKAIEKIGIFPVHSEDLATLTEEPTNVMQGTDASSPVLAQCRCNA